MTDRQPEPTTEAGRRHLARWVTERGHPPSVNRLNTYTADILAIEAEARALSDDVLNGTYDRGFDDGQVKARADERERLAGAVREIVNDDVRGYYMTRIMALLQPDTASES